MCEAGLAGRQRQVGSAGVRQGAGSGRQGGQRQGHRLTVIVVMRLSVTDGSSFTAGPCSLSFSSSSSTTACLQDVLDLAELLPQHLLLVEAEGGVVGCHGEQQQKLLLCPPVVQRQAVVIDHGVYVGQGPVQDPRSLPVVRTEQGEGHQQLAAHHLICDVGKARQVGGVVGFDLRIPQRVVVLAGQVLQARAEETELDGDAEVQQAAQELCPLG